MAHRSAVSLSHKVVKFLLSNESEAVNLLGAVHGDLYTQQASIGLHLLATQPKRNGITPDPMDAPLNQSIVPHLRKHRQAKTHQGERPRRFFPETLQISAQVYTSPHHAVVSGFFFSLAWYCVCNTFFAAAEYG